jgi:hypothetical protein
MLKVGIYGAIWFLLTLLIATVRLYHPELISGASSAVLIGWLLFTGLIVFLIYSAKRRPR